MTDFCSVADEIPSLDLKGLLGAFNDLMVEIMPESADVVKQVMGVVKRETDYFEAPASTRFHLNTRHGLFKHSIGVTYRLFALDQAYGMDRFNKVGYEDHDLALAGLLHDLGKAGQVRPVVDNDQHKYKHESYYVKRELKSRPGDFEYKRSKNMVMMSIPMGSLHFISTVLPDIWQPSLEVWQAIGYHDGMYVGEGSHVSHSECKLLVALHHADYFQARVEDGWSNGQNWTR